MTAEPDAIPLPVDPATMRSARRFLALIGERCPVREAYLFGSRARGTHRLDSDADIAVVLRGEKGDRGAAVIDMAGIAFDVRMDMDVLVEATPLWEAEFDDAERELTRYLVRNIRRDGVRL